MAGAMLCSCAERRASSGVVSPRPHLSLLCHTCSSTTGSARAPQAFEGYDLGLPDESTWLYVFMLPGRKAWRSAIQINTFLSVICFSEIVSVVSLFKQEIGACLFVR